MPRTRHNSWLLSGLLCGVLLLALGVAQAQQGSDQFVHWFVLPVVLCGLLAAEDAVRWLQGELDVFDPEGLIGLFGVHFFFVAPLLHCHWDYWLDEVVSPKDWRPWLGGMAMLNFAGLLLYRFTRARVANVDSAPQRSRTVWRLRPRAFPWWLAGALLLAGGLQFLVFFAYGGLAAYVGAVQSKQHAFLGSSRIGMISESFPVLALIGYVLYIRRTRRVPSWPQLWLVLAVYGALVLLFGGLVGLRTNTIVRMIWGAGILHFCVRPVPRKVVLGGAIAMVAFMYLYGFYKAAGLQGLARAVVSAESRAAVEAEIRRPFQATLLGDLSRSDVQAFVLYRLSPGERDYDFAYGRTYAGAALLVIPGPLWRNRPPSKVKEGTEVLHGRGTYRHRPLSSTELDDKYVGMTSKVYGIAGEAMLNFGLVGVPLAYGVFGVFVGYVSRWMKAWDRRDARWLIMPFLVVLCLDVFFNDSDVVVNAIEQFGLFPFLLLVVGSRRVQRMTKPQELPHEYPANVF